MRDELRALREIEASMDVFDSRLSVWLGNSSDHSSGIGPKIDVQLQERALGVASQLASEHFMTLADLCNRRLQGTGKWIFGVEDYKRWLMGSTKTLYCVGPREFYQNARTTLTCYKCSWCGQDFFIVSRLARPRLDGL